MSVELVGAAYTFADGSSVGPFDWTTGGGELVLVAGPTGCGKSTLLRLISGLAGRHGAGRIDGRVTVDGRDPARLAPNERPHVVGFASQEPADQLVAATIGEEIAFAVVASGVIGAAVADRVSAGLRSAGLAVDPDRPVGEVSGGELQRLVVAAAVAAGARVLLLDEPLAQLDPSGAIALARQLRGIADSGVNVIVAEHRLEPLLDLADRCVTIEQGRIVGDRPPREAIPELRRLGLAVPGLADLRERLSRRGLDLQAVPSVFPTTPEPPPLGRVVARTSALRVAYGARVAVDGVDLTFRRGERVALLGANGSGKSTLLSALCGRQVPASGEMDVRGEVIDVPQDPDLSLFSATVRDEIAYGPSETHVRCDVATIARVLGVADLLDRPPHALSRGQRLRVAVGAALACAPDLLVLDEPTGGQDRDHVEAMFGAVSAALVDGCLLFATHDIDLALRHATRIVVLERGRIVADGVPDEVIDRLPASGAIRVPALARWCRSRGLPVLTADAIDALFEAGASSLRVPSAPAHAAAPPPAANPAPSPRQAVRRGLDPRTRLAIVGCIGLLAVALDRPESLLVLLLASALPLPFLGVSGPWLRRGAAALLVVVWATMMSQSLFYGLYPRTPLFEIGPVVVVREGVAYGLLQSLRFVAVTLAGLSLVASTTPDRLVPALTWFRIPPGLAFLAVTALRSLPTLAREAVVVRDARRRRGRPVWARAPWAWLALEVAMLRPIVARSLRRARTLAETLDVRGFDPLATRPSTERFALADAAAIVPVAGATLLVVATRLLFTLYTADLLWFPRFAGVYAFVRHHL